jgi:D-alanyl-D-alanine carboxypeptidase/D-alanyl-D-alanine-endopeptidase (penicillin-binding protein 4)
LGALTVMASDRAADVELPVVSTPPADSLEPVTPVLSLRRAGDAVAEVEFERAVGESFAGLTQQINEMSCLVVHRDGEPIVAVGPGRPVLPASTQKLLTAAVALQVLGPDHRFVTTVMASGLDGSVADDLYLVGGGDPLLATADYPPAEKYPPEPRTPLEALAQQVRESGVRSVTGQVIGVEDRYDTERYGPSWSNDVRAFEAGPIGALMVNDSLVRRQPFERAGNPALFAAQLFGYLLGQRDVVVGGPGTVGTRPESEANLVEVARIEGAPLSDVIGEMLTTSDDNTAEMLLKEIGRAVDGEGSRSAGARVVLRTVLSWGVDLTGVVMEDGSGLDRGNRLTCSVLTDVLDRVGVASPVGLGLPIAEETGTLTDIDLFIGTGAEGLLRGKTGTLTGARALAGFLEHPDGPVYSFALVVNTEPGVDARATADPLWTELAFDLMGAPTAPISAGLGPAAAVPVS